MNVYDHKYGVGDVTPIHVPSRLYVFRKIKETLVCNPQTAKEEKPSICLMVMSRPDPAMTKSLLINCREISLVQPITDLYILGIDVKDLPEPCVFHLSQHAQSLAIINCTLPLQTLNHLLQQINECSKLRVLYLSITNLRGLLPKLLPDPHSGLPQLEILHLHDTALNKEDLQHLSHILRQ